MIDRPPEEWRRPAPPTPDSRFREDLAALVDVVKWSVFVLLILSVVVVTLVGLGRFFRLLP